jgi:hypothetical protein
LTISLAQCHGRRVIGVRIPNQRYGREQRSRFVYRSSYHLSTLKKGLFMAITTTGNLGPLILQSLAPAMLYVPTPTMNYITVCDKVSMPANGGTTCRFMRPRALTPPTIQLGNSGIDPPAQVPQRDIIDSQMAFFGRCQGQNMDNLDCVRLAA